MTGSLFVEATTTPAPMPRAAAMTIGITNFFITSPFLFSSGQAALSVLDENKVAEQAEMNGVRAVKSESRIGFF